MTINASEMGKKGFKVRAKKYGKKGLAKHAEMMRNAKQAKKALKDKEIIG